MHTNRKQEIIYPEGACIMIIQIYASLGMVHSHDYWFIQYLILYMKHWTKLRFPTCPAYQHMTFPTAHIWQRIGQNLCKQMIQKCVENLAQYITKTFKAELNHLCATIILIVIFVECTISTLCIRNEYMILHQLLQTMQDYHHYYYSSVSYQFETVLSTICL